MVWGERLVGAVFTSKMAGRGAYQYGVELGVGSGGGWVGEVNPD